MEETKDTSLETLTQEGGGGSPATEGGGGWRGEYEKEEMEEGSFLLLNKERCLHSHDPARYPAKKSVCSGLMVPES